MTLLLLVLLTVVCTVLSLCYGSLQILILALTWYVIAKLVIKLYHELFDK